MKVLTLEKKAIVTYRVEDVMSDVSRATNSRKKWDTYKRIEWSDLKHEDKKLYKMIRRLSNRYGYEF